MTLVERLRKALARGVLGEGTADLMREAADRIEELERFLSEDTQKNLAAFRWKDARIEELERERKADLAHYEQEAMDHANGVSLDLTKARARIAALEAHHEDSCREIRGGGECAYTAEGHPR